jgi:cardiolipin synthase (CMP-forming)
MTLPNLITLGRLALVPLAVWCIFADRWPGAFLAFAVAGISDAIDGYVARRFNMRSALGAFLDPLADKALLVSVYLVLALVAALPAWLVLIVVGRDLALATAVLAAWWRGRAITIAPLFLSKVNTAGQIVFAALVLFSRATDLSLPWLIPLGAPAVACLTIASAAAYVRQEVRRRRDGGRKANQGSDP